MEITCVTKWLQDNESQLLPPVCNKMLHNEQLKVMFVGGPNVREDYHIEEGEEFFIMVKGDMCLKTIEKGKRRDVVIREGECYLLPGKIPHSPQRNANTIGLVIERQRLQHEWDGLRYYIKDSTIPLFERWFYCENLGTQLVPIINEFFNSEERITQTPTKYSILEPEKFAPNANLSTDDPTNIEDYLKQHSSYIQKSGTQRMFGNDSKTNVLWYGRGAFKIFNSDHETFLWQWKSDATVSSEGETKSLPANNCILVPKNVRLSLTNGDGDCVTLSICLYLNDFIHKIEN